MYKLIIFAAALFISLFNTPHINAAGTSTSVVDGIFTNGTVYDWTSVGDVVYIVGDFSEVRLHNSAPHRKTNLMAIDTKRGIIFPWSIQVDGPIYAVSADHQQIYIGGDFRNINSQERIYIGAINRSDNSLASWSPQVNAPVQALQVDGEYIYIGGQFTSVNSVEKKHLVQLHKTDNKSSEWNPRLNGPVYSITTDNITIYVGGDFTEVNQQQRQYLAAFDKTTGELLNWTGDIKEPVKSMYLEGDTLYIGRSDIINPQNTQTVIKTYNIQDDINNGRVVPTPTPTVAPQGGGPPIDMANPDGEVQGTVMVNPAQLGFKIPTLSEVMTFIIRGFFVLAGITALFFLLLGALAWITSGGDKDAVTKARNRMQSAVVGVILVVAVMAIVVTLEQIVFQQRLCFGISCPASIPSLIQPT